MMMVVMFATGRLSQIPDVWELAALGRIGEIRRKLGELVRRYRIAICLGRLGGRLEVGRNLLRDLRVFGRILLLKLLKLAEDLGERRQLRTFIPREDGRRNRAVAGCRSACGVGAGNTDIDNQHECFGAAADRHATLLIANFPVISRLKNRQIASYCRDRIGTRQSLRNNSLVVNCAEHQRLVSEHLRAIAEWKKTFDDANAWERALKAERAVEKHCHKHGCQTIGKDPSDARVQT